MWHLHWQVTAQQVETRCMETLLAAIYILYSFARIYQKSIISDQHIFTQDNASPNYRSSHTEAKRSSQERATNKNSSCLSGNLVPRAMTVRELRLALVSLWECTACSGMQFIRARLMRMLVSTVLIIIRNPHLNL